MRNERRFPYYVFVFVVMMINCFVFEGIIIIMFKILLAHVTHLIRMFHLLNFNPSLSWVASI